MFEGYCDIDPDFCSYCGTFLTLKVRASLLTCENCGANFSILSKRYTEQITTITFDNDDNDVNETKKSRVDAVTDRTCSKCGNRQMSYKALQTRSADEGQAVFYTCKKCNHSELEYA